MKDWRVAVAAVIATTAVVGAAQAITDTAFNYSTPRVGYFSINPAAVNSDSSSQLWHKDAEFLGVDGSVNCFSAGVHLPDDARMTALAAWYTSDDVGNEPQFFVQRQRHADGALQTIALALGADDTEQRRIATAAADADLATIDNARYSYVFRVCPGAIVNSFRSARIRYIYRNAGD